MVEVGEQTGWFAALKFRFKGVYPLTEDGYFKAPATGMARSARRLPMGKWLKAADRRLQRAQFEIGPDHLCIWFAAADRPALRAMPERNGASRGLRDRPDGSSLQADGADAARVTLSGPLSANAFDPIFAPEPNARTPYKDFWPWPPMCPAETSSVGDEGFMALASGLPNKKGPPAVAAACSRGQVSMSA